MTHENETTTETCDDIKSTKNNDLIHDILQIDATKKSKIRVISEQKSTHIANNNNNKIGKNGRSTKPNLKGRLDSNGTIDNSCSNITTSTYCNGAADLVNSYKRLSVADRDSVISEYVSRRALRLNTDRSRSDIASDIDTMSRRESSSTYDRDMEIIDLLERERSMDIQDMIERERQAERIRNISKLNSTFEGHHRKLPDITKLTTTPVSPKKHDRLLSSSSMPSSTGHSHPHHHPVSRKSSQESQSKRSSVSSTRDSIKSIRGLPVEPLHPLDENTLNRDSRFNRSRSSGGSSTKSSRLSASRRIIPNRTALDDFEYSDKTYLQNHFRPN